MWGPRNAYANTIAEIGVDMGVFDGNAHHIKNVPGRKTDVRDAEWIACRSLRWSRWFGQVPGRIS
jgi:hypothetical protein